MMAIAILLYNDAQRQKAEEVVHRMVKRAVEMEGTVTGEHGVGLVKRDYLNHELGETTVDAMRKVNSLIQGTMGFIILTTIAQTRFRSPLLTELRQGGESREAQGRRGLGMVMGI